MISFFKKKDKKVDFGDMYAYLPQVLEEKEEWLQTIQNLKQRISEKLDSSNTVYKKCRRINLTAEQKLPTLRDEYGTVNRNLVLSGGADKESFIQKREQLKAEIELTFKTIKYYESIGTEINRVRTALEGSFDPLKKHLRIMEEEVKESKYLLERRTQEELDYFISVNNIESFSELRPIFKARKEEQEDVVQSCLDLCDFSTDQKLIDSMLDSYELEESDKEELQRIFS